MKAYFDQFVDSGHLLQSYQTHGVYNVYNMTQAEKDTSSGGCVVSYILTESTLTPNEERLVIEATRTVLNLQGSAYAFIGLSRIDWSGKDIMNLTQNDSNVYD